VALNRRYVELCRRINIFTDTDYTASSGRMTNDEQEMI
jgi:hypothetical protein